MQLFALGLNHQTAPLAIRERVAFGPERLMQALTELTAAGSAREAAIVSTCNRTEIYCATHEPEQAAAWLARYHGLSLADIAPYLYTHPDREAVRHAFRVASGLDSMVLGEPQILGQMKDAVRQAESAGTLGSLLHKLFQRSFAVAKEVRSTTAIGANIVSMAAAAVHLSERIFERMSDCSVLFIGAGEMIELCAAHFRSANPRRMTIANRTLTRAEAVAAEVGADALPLEALNDALGQYDVVISCTASPLPIVGRGMAERAIRQRRHRPIVMVDLAVPRDIEPEVAKLSDVFLYVVDDLAQIVSAGIESRQSAVQDAEQIIEQGVGHFLQWVASRDAVPVIRALREHAEGMRMAELERAQRALARGDDPRAVLEALSLGLTNKLLHGPTQYLNRAEGEQAQDLVHRMFRLNRPDEEQG